MTLGPAILFLRMTETPLKTIGEALVRIGKVPMFFYLVHIFVLHLFALFAAKLTGYHWSDMVTQVPFWPNPPGYGFSLWMTYAIWVIAVLLLYPLCKRYEQYKTSHKEKLWLSYL